MNYSEEIKSMGRGVLKFLWEFQGIRIIIFEVLSVVTAGLLNLYFAKYGGQELLSLSYCIIQTTIAITMIAMIAGIGIIFYTTIEILTGNDNLFLKIILVVVIFCFIKTLIVEFPNVLFLIIISLVVGTIAYIVTKIKN